MFDFYNLKVTSIIYWISLTLQIEVQEREINLKGEWSAVTLNETIVTFEKFVSDHDDVAVTWTLAKT